MHDKDLSSTAENVAMNALAVRTHREMATPQPDRDVEVESLDLNVRSSVPHPNTIGDQSKPAKVLFAKGAHSGSELGNLTSPPSAASKESEAVVKLLLDRDDLASTYRAQGRWTDRGRTAGRASDGHNKESAGPGASRHADQRG